jgi:hypothetical protein
MSRFRRLVSAAVPLAVGAILIVGSNVLAVDPSPATSAGQNVPGDGAVDWGLLPWVLLGVVISIAIPAFRKATQSGGLTGGSAFPAALWAALRPYRYWAGLSAAVTILIMFISEAAMGTMVAAFIAGYSWDSTVQKISGKP